MKPRHTTSLSPPPLTEVMVPSARAPSGTVDVTEESLEGDVGLDTYGPAAAGTRRDRLKGPLQRDLVRRARRERDKRGPRRVSLSTRLTRIRLVRKLAEVEAFGRIEALTYMDQHAPRTHRSRERRADTKHKARRWTHLALTEHHHTRAFSAWPGQSHA